MIDEADIEAHGPFMIYRKEDTDYNRFKRWNEMIADDPAWEEAIVDRVKLMVERGKNRFCIVMWSMGNESAYEMCIRDRLHDIEDGAELIGKKGTIRTARNIIERLYCIRADNCLCNKFFKDKNLLNF